MGSAFPTFAQQKDTVHAGQVLAFGSAEKPGVIGVRWKALQRSGDKGDNW